mmetsp:Transcript_102670/g.314022  ORF Transcript_102670/g.314022 Transcript_102670/m.314022 type:complete len:172 (-) Transcript_102670:1496-2011(-)
MEPALLIRGRWFAGSRRNVTSRWRRKVLNPWPTAQGACAVASTPGVPLKITIRSASADIIRQSCSMTKHVLPKCETTHRLMTFATMTRCSQSRPALGSSIRYTMAGVPRHTVMAKRCNSPPDKVDTVRSMSSSMRSGRRTNNLNSLSVKATWRLRSNRSLTVLWYRRNFGA